MRDQEHNYEVIKINDGFKVIPRDENRSIISAEIDKHGFWKIYNNKNSDNIDNIPLYSFFEVCDNVVRFLYRDWVSPKTNKKYNGIKIIRWARKKTGISLNHPIHKVWKDSIELADPNISLIHKRCFSVSANKGNWINLKSIIEKNNKYVIDDMLKYRAAVISHMYDDSGSDDWMLSYTLTGKYKSLTRTLIDMPGGIPPWLIINGIKNIKLLEHVKTRIRLFAYSCLGSRRWWNDNLNSNIILRSSDEDIVKALKYMWIYFPETNCGDMRKSRQILNAFNRMFDYRGNTDKIDILGLCKRSVQYHRDEELRRRLMEEEQERRRLQWKSELEKIKKSNTALPKIELPKNKNIKFLNTYKEVEDEGNLMHHCIASYAEKAVKGNCYLFHVDYNGEMASVEVLPSGYVSQSYGPYDKHNEASEYGRNILNKWAKGLQQI